MQTEAKTVKTKANVEAIDIIAFILLFIFVFSYVVNIYI